MGNRPPGNSSFRPIVHNSPRQNTNKRRDVPNSDGALDNRISGGQMVNHRSNYPDSDGNVPVLSPSPPAGGEIKFSKNVHIHVFFYN